MEVLLNQIPFGSLQGVNAVEKTLVGRPMEILLIEDNRGDARLAMEALKEGNVKHRMTLIPDGDEAMQFLRRENRFRLAPRPDIILLDLTLPGKDGREVLAEVKQEEELQSIPIVILTASADHEDFLRSQQLNVDDYLTKPVNLKKFIAVVKQLKARWHADVLLPVFD